MNNNSAYIFCTKHNADEQRMGTCTFVILSQRILPCSCLMPCYLSMITLVLYTVGNSEEKCIDFNVTTSLAGILFCPLCSQGVMPPIAKHYLTPQKKKCQHGLTINYISCWEVLNEWMGPCFRTSMIFVLPWRSWVGDAHYKPWHDVHTLLLQQFCYQNAFAFTVKYSTLNLFVFPRVMCYKLAVWLGVLEVMY
jgi:hypothetical protein